MTVRLDDARGVVAEIRRPATLASAFLMALVGLVLLIACANVANLLLARATARHREIGVRLAIGASRGRIVRQLLTESTLLALLGGLAAFALMMETIPVLSRTLAANVPVDLALRLAPDARVVLFTVGACLVTAVLFGLVPALQSARRDLVTALRADGDRGAAGRSRLRSALVVAQVTLCTVLVAGAVLFIRSLGNARRIDPGFDTAGVVDVPIDLGPRGYDAASGQVFYARLLDAARRLPGVRAAALANVVPLSGSNNQSAVWVEGDADRAGRPSPYFNVVGTDYFATLGVAVRQGRVFGPADVATTEPVAIVNETMARTFWPAGGALGRRLSLDGPTGPWRRVVGVVADTRYNSLGEITPPFLYLAAAQQYRTSMVLQLRIAGPLAGVVQAIGRTMRELDPQLPAARPVTLDADMRVALLPARSGAAFLGAFGLLALLLATVGIYGVASFAVARRTREIGIRSALGARRTDVLRLVIGQSMRRVLLGLSFGMLLAFGLGRLLASQLYGVSAVDPATFVGTPIILGAVALLASWIPARRAAAVDPLVALRSE